MRAIFFTPTIKGTQNKMNSFFQTRPLLTKWWNRSLKLKHGGKNIGYPAFTMFINRDYSPKCRMLMYEGSRRALSFVLPC